MTRKIDLDKIPRVDKRPGGGGRKVERGKYGFAADLQEIGATLFEEYISPNIKDIIGAVFTNLIEQLLWGDSHRPTNRRFSQDRRDYSAISRRSTRPVRRMGSSRDSVRASSTRRSFVVETVIFDDRHQAELVLEELLERTYEYGWTTVGDFYALSGVTASHTDELYGWFDLGRANVSRIRDGWVLRLPDPAYRN